MSYETDGIYVGNCYRGNALAYVFYSDAIMGVWSTNLLTLTPPYELYPNPVAVGDYLWIGVLYPPSQTGGTFSNVIFDITSPSTAQFDVWYYDDLFIALPIVEFADRTDNFSVVGQSSIAFRPVIGWKPQTRNGILARWIFRQCTVGGLPPIVKNHPYTANTPYVETNKLLGDIDGEGKLEITRQFYSCASRTFVGRRNIDRGDDFSAYLNFGDGLNPLGVTNSVTAPAGYFYSPTAPNGSYISRLMAIGDSHVHIATITISPPYSYQYMGNFMVFLRFESVDGVEVKTVISIGNRSNVIYNPSYRLLQGAAPTGWNIYSYGVINIPTVIDHAAYIYFDFYCNSSVADFILLADLILLPADELFIEMYKREDGIAIDNTKNYKHTLDSLTMKKRLTIEERDESGNLTEYMRYFSASPLKYGANSKYRYWFLFCTDEYEVSRAESLAKVKFNHQSNYFSMRGDR